MADAYVLTNPMDNLEKKRSASTNWEQKTIDSHHDSPQDLRTRELF